MESLGDSDPSIKGFNPWQHVVGREWSLADFHAWLASVTPRQIVLHMHRWSFLADLSPGLREDFLVVIDEARDILRSTECPGKSGKRTRSSAL